MIFNPYESPELFVYLNPGFTSNYGYYVNHALNLTSELEKRHVALLHLANKQIERNMIETFRATPFFDHRPHEIIIGKQVIGKNPIDEFRRRLPLIADLVNNKKNGTFNRITFYMYSGHMRYAEAFADILPLLQNCDGEIRAHFNFLYNEQELSLGQPTKEILNIFSRCNKVLEQKDPQNIVKLYVDCPTAVPVYKDILDRQIDILPAAAAVHSETKNVNIKREKYRWLSFLHILRKKKISIAHSAIKIGYMGYPNAKYGYDLVHSLYDSLIKNRPEIEFQFLVRHHTVNRNIKNLKRISKWKKKQDRIIHYTGFMSQKDYFNMMHTCNIMIIPYAREHYAIQTSGVFIESVSLGKVMIVPSKTWFADVINQEKCGKVFESGDIESLIRSTRLVFSEFTQLKENAQRYAKTFSAYWTAKNLLNHLQVGIGEIPPELIRL